MPNGLLLRQPGGRPHRHLRRSAELDSIWLWTLWGLPGIT